MTAEEQVARCPAQARKRYGMRYTEEELMEVLLSDRDFYLATGGGVTFSGGECMLYPAFVARMSQRCRESGISVAIDTAGNVPYSHFELVLPYVDWFLYDI
jgi:pyruvate formate lyase activating enzyme